MKMETENSWDAHGILLEKFFEVFREIKNNDNYLLQTKLTKALVMLRRASWHVINLKEVYDL